MHKRLKLIGKKFGRLRVIRFAGINNYKTTWLCRCDCGTVKQIPGCYLTPKRGGKKPTRSCGCLKIETTARRNFRHGLSKTKIYNLWNSMVMRCHNPSSDAYELYGGRGIKVCRRWRRFKNFIADMGTPRRGMTIERINNNLGYSPSNCKWDTRLNQARNCRNNRLLTAFGMTKPLSAMAEHFGISSGILRHRIDRLGLSVEHALLKQGRCKS